VWAAGGPMPAGGDQAVAAQAAEQRVDGPLAGHEAVGLGQGADQVEALAGWSRSRASTRYSRVPRRISAQAPYGGLEIAGDRAAFAQDPGQAAHGQEHAR
jgi:hypothetical protein